MEERDKQSNRPVISRLTVDSIEFAVKVTAEIHSREIKGGRRLHSLHYKIKIGEWELPDLGIWNQSARYIGEQEGPAWEATRKEWLAEYAYVSEAIRKATLIMAGFLTREASLSIRDDVDWRTIFDEMRDSLVSGSNETHKKIAERYPNGMDDLIESQQVQPRHDLLMTLGYYLSMMKHRFIDPSSRNGGISNGPPKNPIVEAMIDQTIHRMVASQKNAEKIKPWRRGDFDKDFPLAGSRQNVYNYVPSSRNSDLEKRYYEGCKSQRGG